MTIKTMPPQASDVRTRLIAVYSGRFGFTGYVWGQVKALNSHFNTLGFAIIGLFALAWTLSWVIYRAKRLDQYEVRIEASAKMSIVNQ